MGTYGGLSYLAPFFGKKCLAISSHPEHLLPAHNDAAQRAFRKIGGVLACVTTDDLGLVEELLGGGPIGINAADVVVAVRQKPRYGDRQALGVHDANV